MRTVTILLTSVGVDTGPNVIQALRRSEQFAARIIGVDGDPLAAGRALVDAFFTVPQISDEAYLPTLLELCRRERVDIFIPLFSKEIRVIAAHRAEFEAIDVRMLLAPLETITLCEDKTRFAQHLHAHRIAAPTVFTQADAQLPFPVFAKQLRGSASRYATRVESAEELSFIRRRAGELSVQECLTGPEFTIDFLCNQEGKLVAGVARERVAVKDGKAVKARTVVDPALFAAVEKLLTAMKVVGPANTQCILHNGRYTFFEINTRFAAGGLPLTTHVGVNLPELLVQLLCGQEVQPRGFDYPPNVYMSRYLTETFFTEADLAATEPAAVVAEEIV
ncbi:ATP-grasp domain-containing protein [Candidatus Berkelbacteria bacterium]|nr:ATP-grasp domain-containing protein [Candidatus Berkelbacteria bacterium]